MALPFKIRIEPQEANKHWLDPKKDYRPEAMDEEGYYVNHPHNDTDVLIPFNKATEVEG